MGKLAGNELNNFFIKAFLDVSVFSRILQVLIWPYYV